LRIAESHTGWRAAAISPKDRGASHHIKPTTWIFLLTYEVEATQNIGFVVVEAGLQNLTQDVASCLVHFGTDTTQTWLLVRLKQPEMPKTPERQANS
jgi:hypothetical protein